MPLRHKAVDLALLLASVWVTCRDHNLLNLCEDIKVDSPSYPQQLTSMRKTWKEVLGLIPSSLNLPESLFEQDSKPLPCYLKIDLKLTDELFV